MIVPTYGIIDTARNGAGSVLVGGAAFKAVVRGEKLLGCVRFAHSSATLLGKRIRLAWGRYCDMGLLPFF